jgi:hypothetical protein
MILKPVNPVSIYYNIVKLFNYNCFLAPNVYNYVYNAQPAPPNVYNYVYVAPPAPPNVYNYVYVAPPAPPNVDINLHYHHEPV